MLTFYHTLVWMSRKQKTFFDKLYFSEEMIDLNGNDDMIHQ